MNIASDDSTKQSIKAILINVSTEGNTVKLNYYYNEGRHSVLLRNPETLTGNLITGTEISIDLYCNDSGDRQAELILNENDFLPEEFCVMLQNQAPAQSTFFGLISKLTDNRGRYYMLRDVNKDGLRLCTGLFSIRKNKGFCESFDGQWQLRYNMIENFFYGFDRPESSIKEWKHPSIKLQNIDENITIKNLNKKFRNYAAGWHKFNYFFSDDWSAAFYKKQARLGFIAITYDEGGKTRLIPQLQREYAVLDWKNLVIDRKVKKIIDSGRIKNENIKLNIESDPSTAITNLTEVWKETWITAEYSELIKQIAYECRGQKTGIKIWGITLTTGDDKRIIAGELGYTIGKTYTSLTGFFHRGSKNYNNFGKLQMVMLADVLEKAGIAFWNLGQPYMEYKLKLGAEVVPRGLFLKRWDRAVRGRTIEIGNKN